MNWLITTLGTSIGKKILMAVTGLSFIGFLAGHLAGNLTIYGGGDAKATGVDSIQQTISFISS